MKKGFLRFIAVFMIVLVAAVCLPASGIDSAMNIEASALTSKNNAMENSNAKWSYDTKTKILTISGTGAMPNYSDTPTAFSKYNARLVVTIMNNTKTIKIENGITAIGNYVFKGFKNINSVSISSTVTSIGSNAFRDCTSLASISIPSSVKSIGDGAFSGCTSLKSITIPAAVTTISNNTFYGCSSLSSVNIHDKITSIGSNAFLDCKALSSVSVPSSVKTIGDGAFRGCSALKSFSIPSAVTVISNNTFYGCSSLSSVNINEGITSIGENAFRDTKINTVNMPYSVKTIGNNAFGTVKIECSYDDPAYNYCQKHSNATAVIRTPELKVVVTPTAVDGQLKASFYVKNASRLNAANFKIKYNSDIIPVSSELVVDERTTFLSAVSFGEENTISVGIAEANAVAYSACAGECEFKVAEILFNQKDGTHAAKFEYSASVLMLNNKRYTPVSITENYGEHIYQQSGEPVAQSCTEEGYTLFVCTICKDEQRENVLPALGHEYADTVTPPTCEDDGYTTHTCSRCGDSYTDTVVIASGHNLIESAVDATCTEKAKKVLTCDVCGESSALVIEESEINPDNHVNTEIKDVSDATCTADGYTGDTYCNDCANTVSTGSKIPATGHAEEILPAVASTCTTTGLTEGKKCTVCGEITVKQTEVAATGHTEEVLPAVAPTCTATGLTEGKKCSVCNEILVAQTEVAATGHTEEVLPAVAPTCTATGLTEGKKCTVCGEITVAQEVVPTTGHTEEALPAVTPTCTATGLTEGKKCTVCGEITVAQEVIPATGHTEEVLPAVAPTCTATGLTEGKKCTVCGEITVAQTEVPVSEHSYMPVVTAPTCTAKGYTTYTCVCGDTYVSDETEIIAHDYSESIVKEATCKEDGEKSFTCKACGDTYTDVIAKLSHTEETIPATAPTCIATGLTEGKKCTVCGEITVAQEVIPATGHTEEVLPAVAPTCTATGLTEGKKCTVCDEITVAQEVIPVTGHTEEVLPAVAPTCTATGLTEGKKCTVCGEITVAQTEVPVSEHTYIPVVTDPTCLTGGYTVYTCSVCEDTYTADETQATGHTPEIVPGKYPTETETGLTDGEKCSVCGEILKAQEEIPALGVEHTHDYIEVVTAPTCTTGGYTTYRCLGCGDTYIADEKEPFGHAPVKVPGKLPTETESGLTEGEVCSVCGEILVVQEEIPALGVEHTHDYIEVVTAPTCTAKGYTTYTCVCGDTYVSDETEIIAHDYAESIEKEATCKEDGEKRFTCKACGDIYTDVIAKLSHTEEILHEVAPTCTQTGLTEGKKCSVCGEILVAQKEVPVTAHTYDEGVVTAPTCTAKGYTTYTCKNCTAKYTGAETDMKPHTYVEEEWRRKEPTCTETGEAFYECTICFADYNEILPVKEHNYTASIVTIPATCTAKGYTTYSCICGASYVADETDLAEHKEETIPAVASTCTETGLTEGKKCSVCDKILVEQKEVPVAEHDYKSFVYESTCTSKGYTEYTCKNCTAKYTGAETDMKPHTYVEEEWKRKEPTCTETGEAFYECAKCYAHYNEILPVKEHNYTASIVTTPATCTAKGYTTYGCICGASYVADETELAEHKEKTIPAVASTCTETGLTEGKKCSVCDKILVEQKEVPVAEHDYEAFVYESTCTSKGYTEYTCKNCTAKYTGAETDIKPHTYVEEEWRRKEPTCTETGEAFYECVRCYAYYNEILPVTEHNYSSSIITTPATCTAKGYTTYSCICGASYVADETAMIAHDYVETVIKPATCTAEGEKSFTCSMCNDTKTEKIPAEGHSFDNGTVTAPTCTAQGYTTYKCVNCDYSEKRDSKNALGHNYGADGKCTRCGAADNSKPAETVLEFKNDTVFAKNDADKTVLAKNPGTVAQVKQSMINSGWEITDANGNKLADDKDLTTGCLIKSADGKQIYAYAMLGDVNMDGKVTAADARAALRISAKLDTGTAVMLLAADCDGKERVTAADARVILRVSAKLQSF